jgi:hypothetical protein
MSIIIRPTRIHQALPDSMACPQQVSNIKRADLLMISIIVVDFLKIKIILSGAYWLLLQKYFNNTN